MDYESTALTNCAIGPLTIVYIILVVDYCVKFGLPYLWLKSHENGGIFGLFYRHFEAKMTPKWLYSGAKTVRNGVKIVGLL